MSKAFTKEDDDGGFAAPPSGVLSAIPPGPFRLTKTGEARVKLHAESDPRVREALERAEILPAAVNPVRAGLGVTVVVDIGGQERRYRLVTTEESALLGDGCSVSGPIGRALLGAEIGDVREVRSPRGVLELEIVSLEGEG